MIPQHLGGSHSRIQICSHTQWQFIKVSEYTITNLYAHEYIDEGVVGCAGLGKEGGDDGHSGRDHALSAKSHHHRHNSVGCPAHQETGDHEEKHCGDLLLVPQDLYDLNSLKILDGAQLTKREQRVGISSLVVRICTFALSLCQVWWLCPQKCYDIVWWLIDK